MMSENNIEERFTFTWHIENFDMCPQKPGDELTSPTFFVDALRDKTYQLWLYPRGTQSKRFVSCYVVEKPGDFEKCLTFESAISLVSDDISALRTLKAPAKKMIANDDQNVWGWQNFAERTKIIEQKSTYLPNNTLTLKFRAWKSKDEANSSECTEPVLYDSSNSTISKQVAALIDLNKTYDVKRSSFVNKFSARTRIPVRKNSVFWFIKNLSSCPRDHKLTMPVYFNYVKEPLFFLTFHIGGDQDAEPCFIIEIQKNDTHFQSSVFVKCKMRVVNAEENRIFYTTEDEYLFETQEENAVWILPPFFKLSELQKNNYLDLTNDILYLRCELAFSSVDGISHLDTTCMTLPLIKSVHFDKNTTNPLANELLRFYKKQQFCDITLRSEGREISAHKLVLCATSPVFCAMFDTDMKEKENGIVDISDVKPDTLSLMLEYMYTDCLEDLNVKEAAGLYTAADRHRMLPLKSKCASKLTSSLSVYNVCGILELADSHHDHDLLDSVQNFIHLHADVVFRSKDWEDWMKSRYPLAAHIMLSALKRKID